MLRRGRVVKVLGIRPFRALTREAGRSSLTTARTGSTQPFNYHGSINRIPATDMAGTSPDSPLSGGRSNCVIQCDTRVPVVVMSIMSRTPIQTLNF